MTLQEKNEQSLFREVQRLRDSNRQLLKALKDYQQEAESWHRMHHNNPTTQCDGICDCIAQGRDAIAKTRIDYTP